LPVIDNTVGIIITKTTLPAPIDIINDDGDDDITITTTTTVRGKGDRQQIPCCSPS
jgi:hypothetical protein